MCKNGIENDFFQNFKKYHQREDMKSNRKQVPISGSLFNFLFKNCESNSHFVKNANVIKIRLCPIIKFWLHFEARIKSSHDVQKNTFFSDVMLGFCPIFKNEAEIWLFNTAIHARIFIFLKMWNVTGLWHVTCDK